MEETFIPIKLPTDLPACKSTIPDQSSPMPGGWRECAGKLVPISKGSEVQWQCPACKQVLKWRDY